MTVWGIPKDFFYFGSFLSIILNSAQIGFLLKKRGVSKKGKEFQNVSEEELIFTKL